ncbi:MAG: hypothetical protein MUE52_01035 [Tabrizicola sp.]|jgi:hypothetical protein|nr:hypothetical protein [Tabrizicola sp.]
MILRPTPYLGTMVLASATAAAVTWCWHVVQRFQAPFVAELTISDPAQPDGSRTSSDPVPTPRPPVYYAAITERPLFFSTRRPEAVDPDTAEAAQESSLAETTEPAPPEVPRLTLKGTLFSARGWTALVSADDLPAEWLDIGDRVAGLTLIAVGPDWAEFSSDVLTLKLDLYPQ